jgi:hypothetical protein
MFPSEVSREHAAAVAGPPTMFVARSLTEATMVSSPESQIVCSGRRSVFYIGCDGDMHRE